MIAELMIGGVLYAAGFGVLAPLSRQLGNAPRMWLSLPIGAALYLVIAPILILMTGTLDPGAALLAVAAIGGIRAAIAAYMRLWGRGFVLWALAGLGVALATVVISRLIHLTRLTPDSFRYLTVSVDLLQPDALDEVLPGHLLVRQIGLPSLQALHDLTDRRYFTSIGPLFGVFGFGYFTWLIRARTTQLPARRRRLLVATAVLLLLTSNRLVYDAFYINSHIQVAVYLLIAVSGVWLAVVSESDGWAFPAGLALGVSLLFRPEMALVATVVLVAVAASRANWTVRLLVTAPPAFVGAIWYGVILWRYGAGGNEVSLTAPVLSSLVLLTGAVTLVIASHLRVLRPLARYADRGMLIGMAGALVWLSFVSPQILRDSAVATLRNLSAEGFWLLTWPSVIVLAGIALAVHRIPDGRMWTTSIIGFALAFWTLPLVREGAWRVGAGDSGNRILAHFLAIVVTFLVLAAVDWPEQAEKPTQSSQAALEV